MQASIFIGLLVSSTLAFAAPDAKKLRADRDKIATEITKLNKTLTCKADSDCVALEMGRKPCGGPWKYLVASKKNPRMTELKKKLADHAKADEAFNKAAELMSDCSLAAAPEIACIEKTCQAKSDSSELKPQ